MTEKCLSITLAEPRSGWSPALQSSWPACPRWTEPGRNWKSCSEEASEGDREEDSGHGGKGADRERGEHRIHSTADVLPISAL